MSHKCHFCGKEAVINLKVGTGSSLEEVWVCEEHAGKLKGDMLHGLLNKVFGFGEIKEDINLMSILQSKQPAEDNVPPTTCAECMRLFTTYLGPMLNEIHQTYHGKPKPEIIKPPELSEVSKLKQKIRRAIEFEEYEKAAELRDEIKKLEQKIKKPRKKKEDK